MAAGQRWVRTACWWFAGNLLATAVPPWSRGRSQRKTLAVHQELGGAGKLGVDRERQAPPLDPPPFGGSDQVDAQEHSLAYDRWAGTSMFNQTGRRTGQPSVTTGTPCAPRALSATDTKDLHMNGIQHPDCSVMSREVELHPISQRHGSTTSGR